MPYGGTSEPLSGLENGNESVALQIDIVDRSRVVGIHIGIRIHSQSAAGA